MTRAISALLVAAGIAGSAAADVITQWTFNSGGDANFATGTLTPSTGTGVAALIGGTTSTFASGDVNLGSTDPNVGDDSAWNLTTWAAQGTESGQRGARFNVSTLGFTDIIVTWDNRYSNTMSANVQFEYTTDGTTFTSAGLFTGNAGDTWFNNRSVDLTGVIGVANNPNFGFRMVSVFAPGTSQYATANSGSTYGTAGTLRFDMVTVNGAIPTPGSLALLGLSGAFAARRRR